MTAIIKFYPSAEHIRENKKKKHYTITTTSKATQEVVTQYQTANWNADFDKAKKLGITVDEYRLRRVSVLAASNSCKLQTGDTVYPWKMSEFKKHGKLRVVGICRDYDDYGTAEWNNPPFILTVVELDNPNQTLHCSAGWVVKLESDIQDDLSNQTQEC